MSTFRLAALLAVLASAAPAQQMNHADHAGHMNHASHGTASDLREAGQGGFAALSEIVARLSADPATDWSRVDIAALRAHLVDMNRLLLETEVQTSRTPDGLSMRIALPDRDRAALRMVPAHGPVLQAETGWLSRVEDKGDHLLWTVTAPAGDVPKLHALGFFGLMALGDHHRAHHWAIARGAPGH